MELRVLAVGDIVGEGGQDILRRRLRELRSRSDIHFTVVNGENASGVGITPAQARGMLDAGADVITLGNHTWNRIQIGDFLDKSRSILRPANYAGRVPGRGTVRSQPCTRQPHDDHARIRTGLPADAADMPDARRAQ